MSVYVLPSFFPPEACAKVINLFPPVKTAAINIERGDAVVKREVRRSRVSFNSTPSPLLDSLRTALLKINERFFHFEIVDFEPAQLGVYEKADEYDWHLDLGPGSAALRKLSVSVLLSDPDDYEGGDLEIRGTQKIDRTQGTLVVFPSYILHRVTPVISGCRRSLVVWAIGAKPFR